MTNMSAKQVEAQYAVRDNQIYACVLVDFEQGVRLSPLYYGNDEQSARERLEQFKAEYKDGSYQVILMKQVA